MAARPALSEDTWTRYYAAAGKAPRETLLQALALFEAEGRAPETAVDLGCGSGRDTLELLRRGWRVVAVDAEEEGIAHLRAHPDALSRADALETVVARFGEAVWPEALLVSSSFSLPFCPPDELARVWPRIRASLVPGGRFCGQFFGDRDEWSEAGDMTFLSRREVETLLEGLDVERLDEVEHDGQTALGKPKRWHLFHVVARRP